MRAFLELLLFAALCIAVVGLVGELDRWRKPDLLIVNMPADPIQDLDLDGGNHA